MTNRPRQKGTAYETELVAYLRSRGWEQAERRALGGHHDLGDIVGILGVVVEAKNCRAWDLAGWVDELEAEIVNARADTGAVLVRRRGTSDRSRDYAVMTADMWTGLLRRLEGWHDEEETA